MLLKSLNFRRLYNTFFLIPPKKGIKEASKKQNREKNTTFRAMKIENQLKKKEKGNRNTRLYTHTDAELLKHTQIHRQMRQEKPHGKGEKRQQTADGRQRVRQGGRQTNSGTNRRRLSLRRLIPSQLSSVQFSSVSAQIVWLDFNALPTY